MCEGTGEKARSAGSGQWAVGKAPGGRAEVTPLLAYCPLPTLLSLLLSPAGTG
jgi:hypothetical protein